MYEYKIFFMDNIQDISMLLKIYGYEYEYAKFSWIFSMGNPIVIEPNCVGAPRGGKFGNKASLF